MATEAAAGEQLPHEPGAVVPAPPDPTPARRKPEGPAIGASPVEAAPGGSQSLVRAAPPRTPAEIAGAIHAMEERLAATPRRSHPLQHATAAYRLGLAYAESPNGDRSQNLRRAIACYELATDVFDPRFDPVEHARALNAAGAARRELGDLRGAAELFERAAELFEGRDRDTELAAGLNNLGLARAELGEVVDAMAAYDRAAGTFDPESDEGRRGLALTLYNRGQACASSDTVDGLADALDDYAQALGHIDPAQNPYHYALIHQGIGIAELGLAGLQPEQRSERLARAVTAFEEALGVFSRTAFPFQHALTKYNLGLAWSAMGAELELRLAMACFEDVVSVLDPRVQPAPWRRAYASLTRVEAELGGRHPGWTLADHYVALLAEATPSKRTDLLRERLARLLALPDASRDAALIEMDASVFKLPASDARAVVGSELSAVMELPNDAQEAVVRGLMDVRNRLGPEARDAADLVLDGAVGDALDGPQRILVRDFMYSMGFVRP
ncbi:MAG: tetratricopeptide repeat protein [Acidimicrobiales bacterium]